jgi:hypothetical protein
MTDHRLQATPHCVRAGSSFGPASQAVADALPEHVKTMGGTVTRETMAVFLQPPIDAVVGAALIPVAGLTAGEGRRGRRDLWRLHGAGPSAESCLVG